ncbi:hypothetical protein D9M68_664020 [compost metagenome]
MRAVGGTCVDHPDGWIDDGVHRLACRGIGQTEDGDVAGIDGFRTTPWVPAFRRGKREQAEVGPAAQPFVDLQPGGALVAVDKNQGRAHARNTPVTERGNTSKEPQSSMGH